MNERHAAILSVDIEHLVRELGLPRETTITSCRMEFERPGRIEFVIEHPNLAAQQNGNVLPRVQAVFCDFVFKEWQ